MRNKGIGNSIIKQHGAERKKSVHHLHAMLLVSKAITGQHSFPGSRLGAAQVNCVSVSYIKL